jgi:hypothetical protein
MSDPISNTPTVAAGQIAFYDTIGPPLPASGKAYTLNVSQQINGLKDGSKPAYNTTQSFLVSGPRFTIDPAAIHMVYPPADQAGAYADVIPNMVFTDFALPWARSIDATTATAGVPWIALLSIRDDEMPLPPSQSGGPPNPRLSYPVTGTAGQLVTGSSTLLVPKLPDVQAGDTTQVRFTDMDLGFFQGIVPRLTELPYLAHARVVNTDNKVILGMNEDGAFSVVVGNRMAKNGAVNSVLLVSLEGQTANMDPAVTPPTSGMKVRLVVLGLWSFTANPEPGTFLTLVEAITAAGRGGVDLLRLAPSTAADAGDPMGGDPMAQEAVEIGYVPLLNDLRDGEETTSLYRGPLVPAPTTADDSYGPFWFSDHATLYDPDYGLFNQSYACAWQVGRLLALSDSAFAQAMIAWRREYAAAQRASATLASAVRPLAAAAGDAAAPASGSIDEHLRQVFVAASARSARVPRVVSRQARLAARAAALAPEVPEAAAGEDPVTALHAYLTRRGTP